MTSQVQAYVMDQRLRSCVKRCCDDALAHELHVGARSELAVRVVVGAALREGTPEIEVTKQVALLWTRLDAALRAAIAKQGLVADRAARATACLLYTSPSPRDRQKSRMPSSA